MASIQTLNAGSNAAEEAAEGREVAADLAGDLARTLDDELENAINSLDTKAQSSEFSGENNNIGSDSEEKATEAMEEKTNDIATSGSVDNEAETEETIVTTSSEEIPQIVNVVFAEPPAVAPPLSVSLDADVRTETDDAPGTNAPVTESKDEADAVEIPIQAPGKAAPVEKRTTARREESAAATATAPAPPPSSITTAPSASSERKVRPVMKAVPADGRACDLGGQNSAIENGNMLELMRIAYFRDTGPSCLGGSEKQQKPGISRTPQQTATAVQRLKDVGTSRPANCLHLAAAQGQTVALAILFDSFTQNAKTAGLSGHALVERERKLLLETNEDGETALDIAIKNQHINTALLLTKRMQSSLYMLESTAESRGVAVPTPTATTTAGGGDGGGKKARCVVQ